MVAIETKQEIRQKALKCRSEISAIDRIRFSDEICRNLTGLQEYNKADTILFFASFGDEVNLWGAIEHAWEDGKKVVLPKTVTTTNELKLYRVDRMEQLYAGQWGILEPDPSQCSPVQPESISLVIIPGVAFDRCGNRVGYGKGYYDRLLPKITNDAKRIAVGFNCQLFEWVPSEEHDKKLHALITEKGIFWYD